MLFYADFKCPLKSIAYAKVGWCRHSHKVCIIFFSYICESVNCFNSSPNCSIGVPMVNGAVPVQQAFSLPIGNPGVIPAQVLPAQVMPTPVVEPVGVPSECLLLKNMFDPSTEVCG